MIRLLPPQPTPAQLQARAASGMRGCVAARHALILATCERLRRELEAQR